MGNLNKNSKYQAEDQDEMTLIDKIQLWFCIVAVAYFVIRFTVGVIFDI